MWRDNLSLAHDLYGIPVVTFPDHGLETRNGVVPIVAGGYESAMKVDGRHTRTIWLEADGWSVGTIDQTLLPHRFVVRDWRTMEEAEHGIRAMIVRGA